MVQKNRKTCLPPKQRRGVTENKTLSSETAPQAQHSTQHVIELEATDTTSMSKN